MAKIIKGQFTKSAAGTPFYAAPEVWRQDPQYLAIDIWSAGCILHEMLAHNPPFMSENMEEL